MKLLAVVHDMANNALGRAYSLWLVAREAGFDLHTIGPSSTGSVWPVLEGSTFAEHCTVSDPSTTPALDPAVIGAARDHDVIVPVKVMAGSLGVALTLRAATAKPVLLDIDDPDAEVRAAMLRRHLQRARRPATVRAVLGELWDVQRLRRAARRLPVLVSNPQLQESYGGTLIPHVRPALPAAEPRPDDGLEVAFVGSAREHKGLDVLRSAVARASSGGWRLVATADAPADARPWERWCGETTFAEGLAIVARADAIAVPSLPAAYGMAQLPVKLLDAMAAGTPIIASDLPPIRWAVRDAGVLVPPGSVDALARALDELVDARRRDALAARGRARWAEQFSPAAVAPTFADAVTRALSRP